MANTFAAGQTVQLKSGGPLMTVRSVNGTGEVACVWFDKKDETQVRVFNAAELQLYEGT